MVTGSIGNRTETRHFAWFHKDTAAVSDKRQADKLLVIMGLFLCSVLFIHSPSYAEVKPSPDSSEKDVIKKYSQGMNSLSYTASGLPSF